MGNSTEGGHLTIGLLTTYGRDAQTDAYADALLKMFDEQGALILADGPQKAGEDQSKVRRCWSAGDYRGAERIITEEGIRVLHVNYSCGAFQGPAFDEFLASIRRKRVAVAFHAADLAALQSVPAEMLASFAAIVCPDAAAAYNAASPASVRVLMQIRPNAASQPGGDTVLMNRIAQGFAGSAIEVDVDIEGMKNPADYDLVHLFNFATPQITEQQARRCSAAGTPYVVSTLYEDWPVFLNQMQDVFDALKSYIESGQPRRNWKEMLKAARRSKPSPAPDNRWTAEHAAALIASGSYEEAALKRDYPHANIVACRCGYDNLQAAKADPALFAKETGMTDYVLCVGRLECRKNQLMLLKALEEVDLPLVLVTGGFTYQPDYETVCRKFRRRGKTLFTGRLAPEMLASAYAGARVHALPSWFELPGLVSLEAASFGAAVVTGDNGTARDYFGDAAHYCAPDDEESIRNAVLAAYYLPQRPELRQAVKNFTWQAALEQYGTIYRNAARKATGGRPAAETPTGMFASALRQSIGAVTEQAQQACRSVSMIPEVLAPESKPQAPQNKAIELCVHGDGLVKRGSFDEAAAAFHAALKEVPDFARAVRSLGVVAMSCGDQLEAERRFKEALRLDPNDTRSLLGLGAVAWQNGDKEEAFSLYMRAAELNPDDVSSLLYLVDAAYRLKRLDDLESALRRFLNRSPENMDIQYCLAGCYFAQRRYAKASGVVEHILRIQPTHAQAVELKAELEKLAAGGPAAAAEERPDLRMTSGASAAGGDEFEVLFRRADSAHARLKLLEEAKKRKEYDRVSSFAGQLIKEGSLSKSETALAQILQGEALGCQGLTLEADALFVQAETDPAHAYRALAGRGALAASWGRWEEARAFFRRSRLLKPDYDVAAAGLGLCAQTQGLREEAWSCFQDALQSNCENIQALHGTIQLGYAMNRVNEVEQHLLKYLDMNPVDLPMVYSLAGCYYMQGRMDEAAELCRKILLFEPDNEIAMELLQKVEENGAKAVGAR